MSVIALFIVRSLAVRSVGQCLVHGRDDLEHAVEPCDLEDRKHPLMELAEQEGRPGSATQLEALDQRRDAG